MTELATARAARGARAFIPGMEWGLFPTFPDRIWRGSRRNI